MRFRQDARWAIVAPTSIGVRLTPEAGQPVHTSDRFRLCASSAESNVVSVAAALRMPAKVLTSFVAGSPISALIKADLRSRALAYEGPDVPQGNPWGFRHHFDIADSGFGGRGPRLWNDRAGEVGRALEIGDFDTDRLLADEGVAILHLSGLMAGLSPQTSRFCIDLAHLAKENGSLISFHLNHRASFWKDREAELKETFAEIAGLADILVGNEEDYQLALDTPGPEVGGETISEKLEAYQEMVGAAQAEYPGVSVAAVTLRETLSANRHLWGAIVTSGEETCVVEPREIGVLDRIGGGDAFTGGLLYGLVRGWSIDEATHFGWASGAYAVTCLTDYVSPADEAAIWAIWDGNARITR